VSWLRALRDRLDRLAAQNTAAVVKPVELPWTAQGSSVSDRMKRAGLAPPGSEEPPDQTDAVRLRVRIVGGPWGDPDAE
jgi:hypothetical protein